MPIPKDSECSFYIVFRGHWAVLHLPQNPPPSAGLSASITEDGKNMSIHASGQLHNAAPTGEIPSPLQLVHSYAPEHGTDMPCNFLT